VLRQGRFTPAQQRAYDQHRSRYGLDYAGTPRDFAATFGRDAPRVLEIGFGNGEQLLHSAQTEPARDFIGIEVHRPGVGRLMNALADADAGNVRLYNHDAVEVLQHEIADAALAEVRIYFPDPWHKKRHNKRRLIQPDFLALLAARVMPGGRLHLATDWADYAEHMQDTLAVAPQWRVDPQHSSQSERPPWRIETHFERRGLRLGHGVRDFVHERI
jgi:tRNA (guanine-N7-)-methyltransferase